MMSVTDPSVSLLTAKVEEQLQVSSTEEQQQHSSLGIPDASNNSTSTSSAIQPQTNTTTTTTSTHTNPALIICDAGYGLPREARPRKEKILAIARQLVNFLEWQQGQQQQSSIGITNQESMAQIQVVSCSEESVRKALEERTLSLLGQTELPSHVSFSCQSLEDSCQEYILKVNSKSVESETEKHEKNDATDETIVCYLSPDAKESLDPCQKPPRVVVVGLLIDRKVQPNRSHDRASKMNLVAKRWPLEDCFAEISANEPLNVDCILEGTQQWWWNNDRLQQNEGIEEANVQRETFVQAASQAIQHHAERHPSRPVRLKP
jgi:hypothetical protein